MVRTEARLYLTPLARALVAIESSDLMFALDSIPAIFIASIVRAPRTPDSRRVEVPARRGSLARR